MHMCMCDGGVYNVNRRKGFVFVCDFAVLWSISKMIPVSLFFLNQKHDSSGDFERNLFRFLSVAFTIRMLQKCTMAKQ